MKYRFKTPDGEPSMQTIEDSWWRVARPWPQPRRRKARAQLGGIISTTFLSGYRFLPAGRILAGAGTGRSVTLFNCFVMGGLDDSMAGIFDGLKEAALTMQQGGGIGHDFSTLRPKRCAGERRRRRCLGAFELHGCVGCHVPHHHVGGREARRHDGNHALRPSRHRSLHRSQARSRMRLRNFNLSVLVTDAFMAAVKADARLAAGLRRPDLQDISARDLWDQIMRSTYDYAEPGVIFIDRINAENNLAYCETIHAPILASPPIPGSRPPRGRGRFRTWSARPFTAAG